jgi:hypothetical protein
LSFCQYHGPEHRKLLAAGVDAELHIFEAMPHAGFGGTTPEGHRARRSNPHIPRQAPSRCLTANWRDRGAGESSGR